MSLITNIVNFLTADICTTALTLIIGFVVYKISKFYVKVWNLPPGPIPLPLVGNILNSVLTSGSKEHGATKLEKLAEKYGPVATIWLGSTPTVYITDIDIAREVFRKNDFAGRPDMVFNELLAGDIIFSDYGHNWEALRRVAHSAVQKYSTTDKLVYLVSDCVDHTIETIVEKEGLDKPFVPFDYIYNTFFNIIAATVFGKRYELDDPEYKAFKYTFKDFLREQNKYRLVFWIMFPFLSKFDKKFHKWKDIFDETKNRIKDKFESHYEDYDESIVRDFCDTLITAKNEALREGKESAPYLTDESLTLSVMDLFFAGTDTSQSTFIWILLYLTLLPEMQQKMREEIDSQIGDRIPIHEDRNRCHYVMAFISETLRIRNISPTGVDHKAIVNSKIGKYNIPEGTKVSVFQSSILHNEKYWQNSEQFRPERFLEDGKYVTTRPKAFIPFGIGRRVCLGEKLAIADLFLVLVRFLQKTSDYEIVLHFDGDTKLDPNKVVEIHPKPYEISFKKK